MFNEVIKYAFEVPEMNLNPKESLNMFVEKATPSQCPFMKALSTFTFKHQTIKDHLKDEKEKLFYTNHNYRPKIESSLFKTAKFCTGIRDLLKTTLLIKSPIDIHVSIYNPNDGTPDVEVIYNTPSVNNHGIHINMHDRPQFFTEGSSTLFSDVINIKFELPVLLSSKLSWLFLQPTYHNDVPWTIVNGIVKQKFTKLNIVSLMKRPDPGKVEHVYIKADTVLAYMWLPNKANFKYDDKLSSWDIQKNWSFFSKINDNGF